MKEIERNKREEEERRGNEAEAIPNRICDQSLHRFLFGVLRVTVRVPPLLFRAYSFPPSIIDKSRFVFANFNPNRSLAT